MVVQPGARLILLAGASCLAILPSASLRAQINLDFETLSVSEGDPRLPPGWDAQEEGATFEIDAVMRRGGAYSLRVTSTTGRVRFSQVLDPAILPAERVRVSAYVKAGSPDVAGAGLRARVEDDTGLIYIDRTQQPLDTGVSGWTRLEIEAPLAPTATELSFGAELYGGGRAWFDDFAFELVDTMTLPEPSSQASRYVRYALSVIEDNAFVRSKLDWPAYRAAVMRQARGAVTVDDSYLALRYALGALGDGHSHFMTAEDMQTLADAPVENARTGRPQVAPRAELLGGTIGYLRLPGFAGGSHMDRVEFAEGLQAVIAEFDSAAACGWIVDLRDNSGGNLWPMLLGLGPLLGDGEAGASVRPDGERKRFWYDGGRVGLGDYVQLRVRGEPYRLRRPDARVAVLIDDETASAAEILAAAFAARPRTRSFGETTRGATTATRTFELSDGAALILAVASTSDRNGRIYSGPMTPDEVVTTAERRLAVGTQPAVRAARSWLASGQPSSCMS